MRVVAPLMLTLALIAVATAPVAAGRRPVLPPATGPEPLTESQADSLEQAIQLDRTRTEEWLKNGPNSYLATVNRVDFGDATRLVVGSAADCDVRIDDPAMPPHALEVKVVGDAFRVRSLVDTLRFGWNALPYHEAELPPTSLTLGRWSLRLSHQRFPSIIVFDPRSSRFATWHGLDYYPVDLSLRFVAPLTPAPHPDTTIIMSTRGNARRAVRVGWFDLLVHKHAVRLEAHRLLEPGVDEGSLSVFFRDATTGTETYAVGRYVDPERQPDGRWLVDFNSAYNPACAFSPHYNCPIPSKANTLKVAVEAGEKDSHYAH